MSWAMQGEAEQPFIYSSGTNHVGPRLARWEKAARTVAQTLASAPAPPG